MPYFSRNRTLDLRELSIGTYQYDGQPPNYDYAYPGKQQACWDVIGDYGGNHDFQLRKTIRRTSHINGYVSPPGLTCKNLECSWFPAWFDPNSHFPLGSLVTLGNQILARTNPTRPAVSIPTAIGELKDLPMLVKTYGDNLLRQIAHFHLSWRWGIRPMISDIKKLRRFTVDVNRRIAWLKKLRDEGGLGRKVGLGKTFEPGTLNGPFAVNSSPAWVNAYWEKEWEQKQWGSTRWKLAPGVVLPGNFRDLKLLGWQLHLGITSAEALSTAWELMPWSWMIDWFAGIGDFISAYNNAVPLIPTHTCYMRYLRGSTIFHISSNVSGVTVTGPYYLTVERKERYVIGSGAPFDVTLPILDGSKLSVLTSLAALKSK